MNAFKTSKVVLLSGLLVMTCLLFSCSKDSNDDAETETPPVITSITPAEVAIGQTVTINGTGLGNAVVEIATKVSKINSNSNTAIVAVIPSAIALGQASVRVTTMFGTIVSSVVIK